MPALSGTALPTPTIVDGSGKLAFLVSQQFDGNMVSDDITGYLSGGARFIWMINHVFLSAQR